MLLHPGSRQQTGWSTELKHPADGGTPFVVSADSPLDVEPQALLLRFFPPAETAQRFINLRNQFVRKTRWPIGIGCAGRTSSRVDQDRAANPLTTDAATIA